MIKLFWAWPVAVFAMMVNLVLVLLPSLAVRFVGLVKLSNWWLYLNARIISKFLIFLCGIKVTVTGVENLEQFKNLQKNGEKICLISNHTSMLDIPAIFGPLGIKCGFVAKMETAFVPYINLMAVAMQCVFINRKNLKASRKSITKGVARIRKGQSMLIFPEGTRSKTGKIAEFKHGSFRLASESDSIILPITIKGLRSAFEDRKKVFQRTNAYINVGVPVKIDFKKERQVVRSEERDIECEIKNTYSLLGN